MSTRVVYDVIASFERLEDLSLSINIPLHILSARSGGDLGRRLLLPKLRALRIGGYHSKEWIQWIVVEPKIMTWLSSQALRGSELRQYMARQSEVSNQSLFFPSVEHLHLNFKVQLQSTILEIFDNWEEGLALPGSII